MTFKKKLYETFREGTASHFDSLLKKWAADAGVKYEWKFKKGRNGKTQSYFVLDLKWDDYEALPTDKTAKLNGLLKQFNVDFKYSNNNWTPIIESVETKNNTLKNKSNSRMYMTESKKIAINNKVARILTKIIKEEYNRLIKENEMSDNVEELTMFADNDERLYRALMDNYLKNMLTKKKRGVYDHNLAIKLLEYYYQNYVRPEYKRQFKEDIKLTPAERKQFAEYYVNALEETEEFQNQETKQLK